MAAVVLLVAAGLYIGGNRGGTARGTAVSSSPAVVHVVTGPELVKMWNEHPAVCGNPTGTKDKPADPEGIMGDTPWPDRVDIDPRLEAISSTGTIAAINEHMRFLGIVVLRTQSDIVNNINKAANAASEARAAFTRAIERRNRNYIKTRDDILNEISAGRPFASAVNDKYHEEWVCPDA